MTARGCELRIRKEEIEVSGIVADSYVEAGQAEMLTLSERLARGFAFWSNIELMKFRAEIDVAVASQEALARGDIERWIEATNDLPTLAKLYKITGEGYYRIKPELGRELECKSIQNYLLECIRQDVKDNDEIESRYEAAGTLHGWLRQLLESGDCDEVIRRVAHAVTELFLTSGEEVRNAIETGFLEHALESAGLRPYFEHWSQDSRLRDGWDRALEWGKAHPDFSWNNLQELRRLMENNAE
jgi:hypothetical protein